MNGPCPRRTAGLWLLAGLSGLAGLGGCSMEAVVQVSNRRGTTARLVIEQFRGDASDPAQPPRGFDASRRLHSQRLELEPGASRSLKFSGAAGGFWLRWRIDEPGAPEPATLDLLQQPLVIDIT